MKVLALDIGGVCLHLTPERTYQAFGWSPDKPMPPSWMKIFDDYSIGLIGTYQFAMKVHELTGLTLEQIHDAWDAFLGPEIPETTKLLEKLWGEGWNVVFFSDTQPWHIEKLRDILSYSKKIPEAIYSCDIGALKPSSAMYQAFERRFGVPDLYLDDRECNIEGARARGWTAQLYKTPAL